MKRSLIYLLSITFFPLSSYAKAVGPSHAHIFCDANRVNCVSIENNGECRNGEYNNAALYSNDGMKTWQKGNTSGCSSYFYNIRGLSCQNNLEYCVAVGALVTERGGENEVLTIVSHNKGVDWSSAYIPFSDDGCGRSPTAGGRYFNSIECDQNGYCKAAGICFIWSDPWEKDFISTTKDGGMTWETKIIDSHLTAISSKT